jgi:hypothetical protein
MKDFIGKNFIEAFTRESWCYGVQVTTCCMFLNFENAKPIKILHSNESHSWEFEEVDEIFDKNSGIGDSEFFYQYPSVSFIDGMGLTLEEFLEDKEGNWRTSHVRPYEKRTTTHNSSCLPSSPSWLQLKLLWQRGLSINFFAIWRPQGRGIQSQLWSYNRV